MQEAARKEGSVLDIRRLSPALGAEIRGVDLSKPLGRVTLGALYDAFLKYGLLAFPDQRLDDDQHVAFARHWGQLQVHVLNQYQHQKNPEIFMLTNLNPDGTPRGENPDPGAAIWHTDGSWARERGLVTMLHSMTIPKAGGDTLFCNMYRAYEAMPAELQRQLEGRRAVHDLNYSRQLTGAKTQMTDEQRRKAPPVDHEIIRTHPETGRKALYLGQHASHIEGMPVEQGRALIAELNALATQPHNVYTHRWRVGEMVIWDNRCLMHKATGFDFMNDVRIVRRTTTVGERLPARA
jgi:taurine dioxygenase